MICPIYCPLCNEILKRRGSVSTETSVTSISIQESYECPNHDYACSQHNQKLSWIDSDFSEIFVIGTNEEMFKTGCKAIRVFYRNEKIITNQIDMKFIHKKPFKIGIKINDEIFNRVFSRNNLHPLLEKIEKYEVFS